MKLPSAASFLLLVACSDAEPLPTPELLELRVDGGALAPGFAPDTRAYTVETGLLTQHTRLHGTLRGVGELRIVDQHAVPLAVERGPNGSFSTTAPLALGVSSFELSVGAAAGASRYTVSVTRHPEPWRNVHVLGLTPPVENAYFGDYLRTSERWLYVNASRRGRLYRKEGGAWVFDRPSEELLPMPLEWMFEAALTDDALVFVAQPHGGTETLFAFSIDAGGSIVLTGEHETNDQGTLRLLGDELVFATADRVEILRRTGGTWMLTQTLTPPATGIGFALRPTYFDAPGVALSDGVLVVGAPLASSPTPAGVAPSALECADADACAHEAGAVLVYERDASGMYRGPAVLKPPTPVPGLQFGHATALDGELLAVGAPRDGSTAPESGAVFLFRREAAGWKPAGVLKPSLARPYDYFGDELVVAGDVVLVGAPGQDSAFGATLDDASALDSGGVLAFVRDGATFRELGLHKLPPEVAPSFPFPEALQRAGSALAAASNTSPGELGGGATVENAGRAYFLSW